MLDDVALEALRSREFIEKASDRQHETWAIRNSASTWVDKGLLRPYGELTSEQQDNDRIISVTAIRVYLKTLFDLDFEPA